MARESVWGASGFWPPVRLGVSACLAGRPVRYAGDDRALGWLLGPAAGFVECVEFCPEVGIGLGVPRPPIQWREQGDGQRGVVPVADADFVARSERDLGPRLAGFAQQLLGRLDGLDGVLLKARSPSCGLGSVPVFAADGSGPLGLSDGAFSGALRALRPRLACVDEQVLLGDGEARWWFLLRVFALARWRALKAGSRADWQGFHARYKYVLMGLDAAACSRLGRLLGQGGAGLWSAYGEGLSQLLALPLERGRLSNALAHVAGYFPKQGAWGRFRADSVAQIGEYRAGRCSWLAVLALLREGFWAVDGDFEGLSFVQQQVLFEPFPAVLGV